MENIEATQKQIDPNKYLVWNTNNDFLLELDTNRNLLNKKLAILEDQVAEITPSIVTGRSIKRISSYIRQSLHQVDIQSNFEKILSEDIERNCIAAETYASFVFDKKLARFTRNGKHFSVATFLRNFYGLIPRESPYNLLLRESRNHKHDIIHKYFERIRSMEAKSRFVYLKDTLPKLEELVLPKVKKIMVDFALDMNMPKERLNDFELYFDQIGGGYAFYDGSNNLASLDPSKILVYKNKNGEQKIFEGIIISEATHENIHNLHSAFSDISFPRIIGLHGGSDSYNSLHVSLSEGIARRTERLSIPFYFEKHKKELGLSDKDLEIMDLHSQYHLIRRHYQTLYTIFTVMQNTESLPSFDRYKKLAEITGIPYFNRDHYLVDDVPLSGWMYFIGSILGSQYIKKCLQETNDKYGWESVDDNMGLILRGFMTGHWQVPTHYKFFNQEYLPKLESMGILVPKNLEQKAVS